MGEVDHSASGLLNFWIKPRNRFLAPHVNLCIEQVVTEWRAGSQPKRITEADRVVAGVGIQVHPAREPDGILRQERPLFRGRNPTGIPTLFYAHIPEAANPLVGQCRGEGLDTAGAQQPAPVAYVERGHRARGLVGASARLDRGNKVRRP